MSATERLRIRYPRLWLLQPGMLLLIVSALPAAAWISPRLLSAELWSPIDVRRLGVTWLGISTVTAVTWLIATARARAGVGRRVRIGFAGASTVTAIVLLWVMVVPNQLAIRSAEAVDLGLRGWSEVQADARALDLLPYHDGTFHVRGIGDPPTTLSGFTDTYQALCFALETDARADRFQAAGSRYVPPGSVPELRAAIRRITESCRQGDPALVDDDDPRIDVARDALCRMSWIHVWPATHSFGFLAFSLGGALMIGLTFAAITQLSLAATARMWAIGTAAFSIARLAGWTPWDASHDSPSWTYGICLAAVAGLVVVCSSPLRRTRAGAELVVACVLVPVFCMTTLLTFEPALRDSVLLWETASAPVLGIELAMPGFAAETAVVWLAASYLVLSPLLGWCLARYGAAPRDA